jgi:hypothetical protein
MARAKHKQHHSKHHSASGHHSTQSRNENNDNARHGAERVISAGQEQIGRMQRRARSAFDVFSGPMARIMDQNFSLFQRTVQAMHEESLRFVNRRLEHTNHFMETSRDFQGVSGLMQLQQQWMLDLARDCSEQATRFAEMMREIAIDSTEHLTEAASESLERSENAIEDGEEDYERQEEAHRASA